MHFISIPMSYLSGCFNFPGSGSKSPCASGHAALHPGLKRVGKRLRVSVRLFSQHDFVCGAPSFRVLCPCYQSDVLWRLWNHTWGLRIDRALVDCALESQRASMQQRPSFWSLSHHEPIILFRNRSIATTSLFREKYLQNGF